jgi:hypothetical protein
MITIKYLDLNWQIVLKRYFLMMLVVIIGIFSNMFWIALFALPIFMSAVLGIRIIMDNKPVNKTKVLSINKQNTVVVGNTKKAV